MRTKWQTRIIALVLTLATGIGGASANYFLLAVLWTLPPSPWESVEMALFYGSLSYAIKYPILRFFDGIGW